MIYNLRCSISNPYSCKHYTIQNVHFTIFMLLADMLPYIRECVSYLTLAGPKQFTRISKMMTRQI